MLKLLSGVLKSPITTKLISSTQPKLAPVAFGGGVVAGVVSVLIGGYKITDCIKYQTARGQCDVAIEQNLPLVIAGSATIFSGWGAFNTYNPKLHALDGKREEQEYADSTPELPEKELVVDPPTPPHPEVVKNLYSEGNTQAKVAEMLGISLYAVKKALRS